MSQYVRLCSESKSYEKLNFVVKAGNHPAIDSNEIVVSHRGYATSGRFINEYGMMEKGANFLTYVVDSFYVKVYEKYDDP